MGGALLEAAAPVGAGKTACSQILVLGLGNILFCDEGIGVRVVDQLQEQFSLPENVQTLDGGTLGLDLLTYFTPDVKMLIIDAVLTGQAPGSLVRLEGSAIPTALAQKMSMHQLGLQDLLAASILRGKLPERVVLWGMTPALVDWGTELSPPAEAAVPGLLLAVVQELKDWGVEIA